MRITNGMMVTNMLRDITRNQVRMDALSKNLSTGKKFLKPSDDPLGVSKSLRLNTDISTISQFKRNVEDSQSWLSSTETATDSMIDILQRVRELTVKGANGTNSTAEREAISAEVSQLKEQLIHVGNSSYAGSYLFSGYKTNQPLLKSDGTYDLGGGELNNKEIMDVNFGIGDKFGINFVGQRLFGVAKNSLDLDKTVSQGVFDYTMKGISPATAAGAAGNLTFNYGEPSAAYTVAIDLSTTPADLVAKINAGISADPALKNHVSASFAGGAINMVADKPFELTAWPMNTDMGAAFPRAAMKETNFIGGGEVDLVANPLTVAPGETFSISYGGTTPATIIPIDLSIAPPALPGSVTYNNMQDVADAIQADIDTALGIGKGITVKCENNKLAFNSDASLTISNGTPTTLDLSKMGVYSGETSEAVGLNVKSGEETQLLGVLSQLITDLNSGNQIGIDSALSRLDIHLDNANAVRAEIGVKSNRLELTSNRIEDDTLNLKTLLSTNEDADMAEVIMNLKMEENVYKSSLSGGARIIQPSLLDFLR